MSKKEVLIHDEWIEREPTVGEFYREIIETAEGSIVIEQQCVMAESVDIEGLKAERMAQVKQEAESRIVTFNWRLERAQERAALGITGEETVEDVMQLREAIRVASNQAETAINQLTTVEAIEAFRW